MALEIQVTMNVLSALSGTFQLASNFTALTNVLEQLSPFIKVLPFVGDVLALGKHFQQDKKHKEILKEFEKLGSKIDQVRDDMEKLESTVKWESVKLQFGDLANQITLGMSFCLGIVKAKDKSEKMNYQERLEDLCSNQKLALALNSLLNGMIGNGFLQSSILDEYYQETNGHLPKISAFASELLQLVCGGLMVNATYEAAMRGKEGAHEMAKQFEEQLRNAKVKVHSVLRMCLEKFEENMLSDLNHILDKGGSNEALLNELLAFMSDKYYWQEHFCVVYDDLVGHGYHCFNGFRVESLHRNNKCGIVFYRTAGEPPRFSNRYNEAFKIAKDAYCYYADEGFKNIVAKLKDRRIGWMGCAVIYRSANVQLGGKLSTAYVNIVGDYAHVIVLLK